VFPMVQQVLELLACCRHVGGVFFGFTVNYLVLLIVYLDFFVNVSLVVKGGFVLRLGSLFVCVTVEVASKGS